MNKKVIIALFAVLAFVSCIENDLPKPVVDLYIASLDVEGTEGDVVIDRSTYTATIPLAEETDIVNVKFNSITYGADVITNISYEADTSKIVASQDLNGAVRNMSKLELVTLSYFQSYEWTIVATQTINRIWRIDGQIGTTEWDVEGHRAIARRRNDIETDVKTLEVRLGPSNYEYPTIEELDNEVIPKDSVCETIIVNNEVKHNVTCKVKNISVIAHGRKESWHLIVVPVEASLTISNVAAGANVIWVKAEEVAGTEIELVYRKKGESEWTKVKDEWYATDENNPYNRHEQGYVKAVIRGLEPATEYEISGYADGKLSEEAPKVVMTSLCYQMPNSQMEEWGRYASKQDELVKGEEGPCWYPFSSLQEMFWATGNPGSTTLGADYNLTYPAYKSENVNNVPSDSTGESSAYMGSQNVLNMKFAAGNLFVGHYGETIGTNATVYFGRPISQDVKPVALRFKTKYLRGNINCIGNKDLESKRGEKDLIKVFVGLTDWSAPHCVDSANKQSFFDPRTAAGVLGIGYFDSDSNLDMVVENTEEWHTMTIPIEYSAPEVTPTHLVLTFTCSGYGDYFTGSSESWMYVDDIEFLYDLDDSNQPK